MKNKELYDKTVAILIKAYLNDTLEHVNCHACAVGNIIAANCGLSYNDNIIWNIDWESELFEETDWFTALARRRSGTRDSNINIKKITGGYTWDEVNAIEGAFESVNGMFEGLVAVIEVLGQIHELDLEITQQSVKQFEEVKLMKIC